MKILSLSFDMCLSSTIRIKPFPPCPRFPSNYGHFHSRPSQLLTPPGNQIHARLRVRKCVRILGSNLVQRVAIQEASRKAFSEFMFGEPLVICGDGTVLYDDGLPLPSEVCVGVDKGVKGRGGDSIAPLDEGVEVCT